MPEDSRPMAHLLAGLDAPEFATPNCPTNVVPMEPYGEGSALVWRCPECGMVGI